MFAKILHAELLRNMSCKAGCKLNSKRGKKKKQDTTEQRPSGKSELRFEKEARGTTAVARSKTEKMASSSKTSASA